MLVRFAQPTTAFGVYLSSSALNLITKIVLRHLKHLHRDQQRPTGLAAKQADHTLQVLMHCRCNANVKVIVNRFI